MICWDPSRRTASADELPDLNLLPVLIRCREWRDHIRLPILTLLKNIGDITGQSNLSGLSDALVPQLKKGQVLLLVDGLDEIHNDADRTTFVDHLESFLDQYKQVRIVVTSREAGFNLVAPSLSRFCERWRLAPLTKDAIESLCRHWHRLMTGDTPAALAEGQEVAQTLLKNGALRRLAENPLLLTMLLVVKHGAGGFGRGLLISMGILWNHSIPYENKKIAEIIPIDLIEPFLFHEDRDIWPIAAWVWTNTRRRQKSARHVSPEILNSLLAHWLEDRNDRADGVVDYAMGCQVGIDRDFWTPKLTKTQVRAVRARFVAADNIESFPDSYKKSACLFVAYHAKSVWTDGELISLIDSVAKEKGRPESYPKWDVVRAALGVKTPSKKRENVKTN